MPAGEPFSAAERSRIESAIDRAAADTGMPFSVFVGDVDGGEQPAGARRVAEMLHAALGDQSRRAVLVLVAPGQRRVEIITGSDAARRLDDRACALAAASMTSAFAGGDIPGGVAEGLRQLSSAARRG